MVIANEKEKVLIQTIEDVVCKYFNVEPKDLVNKNKTKNVSMARNFVFYILHYEFYFSINKIANEYFRTSRAINLQNSIMRVCIKNNKVYRNIYDHILEELKKDGIL